jgi:hypothetical protein
MGNDPHAMAHRGETIACIRALPRASHRGVHGLSTPPNSQSTTISLAAATARIQGRRRAMSRGRPLFGPSSNWEGMT